MTTTAQRRIAAKTIAIVTALGTAAALLTACGSSSGNDALVNAPPPATTTAPADPAPAPAPAEEIDEVQPAPAPADRTYLEQAFLETIREGLPSLAAVPDQTLLNIGHTVAQDYHNGATIIDLVAMLMDDYGFSADEAGGMIGGPVAAFGTDADGARLMDELDALDSGSNSY